MAYKGSLVELHLSELIGSKSNLGHQLVITNKNVTYVYVLARMH